MNIEKTYSNMNLHEKREMFETILFKDTNIFNYAFSSLDEASQVAHVCLNELGIQLTIHPESNIQGDRNACVKCKKDILPQIPKTNNFCSCKGGATYA